MNEVFLIISIIALASACAVLSVFVVARHWALIGEGISHSGFGGAGTAWLLALLFPTLDQPWVVGLSVVIFCMITAMIIGSMTQDGELTADAAIGVFLVASLAWGFLAQRIYFHVHHAVPSGFETLLFGNTRLVSPQFAVLTVCMSIVVLLIVAGLRKEILAYCFDPLLAQTSGVRAGFIHYLLIALLAVLVILGCRIVGSVLMTALLVLPGASAIRLANRMRSCVKLSVLFGVFGALVGVFVSLQWSFVPTGAAIVLCLFVQFSFAFLLSKIARFSAISA